MDPPVEVVPEAPLGHQLAQVDLRRDHHPDVDPNGGLAPDPLELTLLKRPQQLHLRGQRHVVDVVEEQGPPAGELEPATALTSRVGERALLVAEELRLQQALREGGTGQGDEGALPAGRVIVHRPREALLAGPALPLEEDGRLAVRHAPNALEDHPHGLGLADDAVEAANTGQLPAQARILLPEAPRRAERLDPADDGLVLEGLLDVVDGPEAHGLDGVLDRRVPGHHQHGPGGIEGQCALQDRQSSGSRQANVREDQLRRTLLEQRQG